MRRVLRVGSELSVAATLGSCYFGCGPRLSRFRVVHGRRHMKEKFGVHLIQSFSSKRFFFFVQLVHLSKPFIFQSTASVHIRVHYLLR
jgi:hypothetical protein